MTISGFTLEASGADSAMKSISESHVRGAVFVNEPPRSLDEQSSKVVIGIASLVSGRPVANFEVHNLLSGFMTKQCPSVTCARLKTGARSGTELGSPFICVKCWSTLENIDKFVLLGVRVTKGRNCIGSQPREVYAKVCEAKEIAKGALLPASHARRERLWIDGRFRSCRHFRRDDRDRL